MNDQYLKQSVSQLPVLQLCNAYFTLTGYELTILSAPRSMQATAMGMFYAIYGIGGVAVMVVYNSGEGLTEEHYYIGIGLNLISIAVLGVMEKKIGLGLDERCI